MENEVERILGISDSDKPTLRSGRIAAEIGSGALGGGLGVGIGILAAVIHDRLTGGRLTDGTEFRGLGLLIYSIGYGSIGYILGNSMGVYLVGNIGNETGSFWATLGGSVLGSGVGFVASRSVHSVYETLFHGAGNTTLFDGAGILVGSTIIATTGFNLTRRYKSPLLR